jgi:hypothetical protein
MYLGIQTKDRFRSRFKILESLFIYLFTSYLIVNEYNWH